jgi:hypothetical protein
MQYRTAADRAVPSASEQQVPAARGDPGRHGRCSLTGVPIAEAGSMLDLILIATTVIFFGAAWAYVHACERM